MVIDGKPFEVGVGQQGSDSNPLLDVRVMRATPLSAKESSEINSCLERSLGTNVDLSHFYRFGHANPKLKSLITRFCGMKPPRFPTVFEALVNGITCQQLSLTLGIILLNRLAMNYGTRLNLVDGQVHAFPRPSELARLKPNHFRKLGYSRQKGAALIELSKSITDKKFDPDDLENMSDEQALETLDALRGVGRWTSQYVLLRGLGRIHIFPLDDIGACNSLQRWLRRSEKLNYEEAQHTLSPFARYAGLVYFHLLLQSLQHGGIMD